MISELYSQERLSQNFCCSEGALTLNPVGAVRTDFLFPDRDSLFECINAPAAGFEGDRAVRRTDRDDNACFAEFDASQPMLYRDVTAPFRRCLFPDAAQRLLRHREVGAVFEEGDFPSTRLASNLPDEAADSSIGNVGDLRFDRSYVQYALNDLDFNHKLQPYSQPAFIALQKIYTVSDIL